MCSTYTCILDRDAAHFAAAPVAEGALTLPRADFDRLISRRQRGKMSTATRIALAMFKHFRLQDRMAETEADPSDVPLVICNRYAHWDYVSDTMCQDVEATLDQVNNYVATAWFPATIQGHLTIEYGNVGEAITVATADLDLRVAAIRSLFPRDAANNPTGTVLFGTFECVPKSIGHQAVEGARPGAFGAISLIPAGGGDAVIRAAVQEHEEMYGHVFQ